MGSSSISPSEEGEQRTRLPTLLEVLGRRTLAPVDLFSFYIYMRDQQRSVDYLDFWLDVSQHMSLCRHYVRELRRSVLMDTPEMERLGSKRSSQVLESFAVELESPSHSEKSDRYHDVSEYLRSQNDEGRNAVPAPGSRGNGSPHNSPVFRSSDLMRSSNERTPPQPAFARAHDHDTQSTSPARTVARPDIRASAEKILYTYLLPGSEREIVLPDYILHRVVHAVENEGRDDPEAFNEAKDYVFQAMERDAFPAFLQAKALGNLVPLGILVRLVLGLICLMAGFWAGFYVILRDKPRPIRCLLIIPFLLGSHFLVAYQYKIDMVMALLGYSEYTFMSWTKIREPYVRTLLLRRACMALALFHLLALILCLIFILVPGADF